MYNWVTQINEIFFIINFDEIWCDQDSDPIEQNIFNIQEENQISLTHSD